MSLLFRNPRAAGARAALAGATLASAAMLGSNAHAGEWDFNPRVELGAEYNDNYRLAASDQPKVPAYGSIVDASFTERLLDPRLQGKPVIVGGLPGQRGVVTSASYEVRALGVRAGMSLSKAHALAPHAVYLPTRHGVYGEYAEQTRRIARGYTPVSQVASIDEMLSSTVFELESMPGTSVRQPPTAKAAIERPIANHGVWPPFR